MKILKNTKIWTRIDKICQSKIMKKIAILPALMGFLLALGGSTDGKLTKTMNEMEAIGSAVEAYMADHHRAPEVFSIAELARLLEPRYLERCPLKDAWGNELHFAGRNVYPPSGHMPAPPRYCQYWLGSGGTSGKFGGFLRCMVKAPLPATDIIYSNGEFKSRPTDSAS